MLDLWAKTTVPSIPKTRNYEPEKYPVIKEMETLRNSAAYN